MSIKLEDVVKIAHLARLSLPESTLEQYAGQLSNILAMVEKVNELDTEQVEPLANPLDNIQRLRKDEVTETDQHNAFMQNAPASEAGVFLVPKVIETIE